MNRGPLTGGCWPAALILAAWIVCLVCYVAPSLTDRFDFPNYEART